MKELTDMNKYASMLTYNKEYIEIKSVSYSIQGNHTSIPNSVIDWRMTGWWDNIVSIKLRQI